MSVLNSGLILSGGPTVAAALVTLQMSASSYVSVLVGALHM